MSARTGHSRGRSAGRAGTGTRSRGAHKHFVKRDEIIFTRGGRVFEFNRQRLPILFFTIAL
ncbi:MAG: hypothetical protein WDM89_09935 [Rhizomicrobium sp.]